jgi:hypothetical protein
LDQKSNKPLVLGLTAITPIIFILILIRNEEVAFEIIAQLATAAVILLILGVPFFALARWTISSESKAIAAPPDHSWFKEVLPHENIEEWKFFRSSRRGEWFGVTIDLKEMSQTTLATYRKTGRGSAVIDVAGEKQLEVQSLNGIRIFGSDGGLIASIVRAHPSDVFTGRKKMIVGETSLDLTSEGGKIFEVASKVSTQDKPVGYIRRLTRTGESSDIAIRGDLSHACILGIFIHSIYKW